MKQIVIQLLTFSILISENILSQELPDIQLPEYKIYMDPYSESLINKITIPEGYKITNNEKEAFIKINIEELITYRGLQNKLFFWLAMTSYASIEFIIRNPLVKNNEAVFLIPFIIGGITAPTFYALSDSFYNSIPFLLPTAKKTTKYNILLEDNSSNKMISYKQAYKTKGKYINLLGTPIAIITTPLIWLGVFGGYVTIISFHNSHEELSLRSVPIDFTKLKINKIINFTNYNKLINMVNNYNNKLDLSELIKHKDDMLNSIIGKPQGEYETTIDFKERLKHEELTKREIEENHNQKISQLNEKYNINKIHQLRKIEKKSNEIRLEKTYNYTISNYNMAMKELMEFIMDFPRNQIEQVNLQYIIN